MFETSLKLAITCHHIILAPKESAIQRNLDSHFRAQDSSLQYSIVLYHAVLKLKIGEMHETDRGAKQEQNIAFEQSISVNAKLHRRGV